MTAMRRDRLSAPRRIFKVITCSVVALVVGSLGTFLYHAVEKARNAARASATT
jgi:hypothetical protein